MLNLDIIKSNSYKDIKKTVPVVLQKYGHLFPASKEAKILLKPNLNANMNALTGNTTDLRLLAAVIEYLKSQGYHDIAIGEGTNSGYYRHHISVISRLRVDQLAHYYGIHAIDLNYSEPVWIEFEGGVKAGVARECLEADLFINLPKLKTHFEAGMSVCLKNLMGCLVGQENKKKTHQSLAANILNINKRIKPHLHIVDGIISMEGLGPTRGTPVHTGVILIGTDPYLVDLMCARFASFDYRKVRTLMEAERRGMIGSQHHRFVNDFPLENVFQLKPAKSGPIAGFIHSPKRQRYFLAIRNTKLFNYLCATKMGGKILFKTGLRQDVFIEDEMRFKGISINKERCSGCNKCDDYCPVGIKLPDDLKKDGGRCIECLYCFMICPEKAIDFEGELGFMNEQLRQYDSMVRGLA